MSSLFYVLAFLLIVSNVGLAEKFYLKGGGTKVALIKSLPLRLGIYPGPKIEYEIKGGRKFALEIGGVSIQLLGEYKETIDYISFAIQYEDNSTFFETPRKITVFQDAFRFGDRFPENSNFTFVECANNSSTISISLLGDVPDSFRVYSDEVETFEGQVKCGSSAIVESLWLIGGILMFNILKSSLLPVTNFKQ